MRTPTRFKAEKQYERAAGKKANKNLPMMAAVGNGDGATAAVAGRDNFYWIRLVNDDNRLTQAYCQLALSYDDLIYVAKAKDEKITWYEFVAFIQDADGETIPPVCPKFAQVVYVSANGCHFTTVGAAVTYINGLATGPAAGREFMIEVQAGAYTETANITVPRYVHIRGQGEPTIINMGAFALYFANDDTSLESIYVKGTGANLGAVLDVEGDDVVFREVRVEVSAGNYCVILLTADRFEGYHVVCESTNANGMGWLIDDSDDVLLWDCKACDTTYFFLPLYIDNDTGPSTVTTKFCEWCGDDYDVYVETGSEWRYFRCNFNADNCAINGTETPLPEGNARLNDVKALSYSWMRC